jgi:hypothetical protein
VGKIIDKTVLSAFWVAVASSAVIFFAMYANWLVAGFQLHGRPVPIMFATTMHVAVSGEMVLASSMMESELTRR